MTICLRKNIEFKTKYITFEISNRWLYLIKKFKLIKFSNTVIRQIFKGLIELYRSIDNTYAKQNGGKYDFIIDGIGALPLQAVST